MARPAQSAVSTVNDPMRDIERELGVAQVANILGVNPRTIERRRASRQGIRPLERQRETKLIEIWNGLLKIFTIDNARQWLALPNPALGGRPPVEIMAEDGGLDKVLHTIGRMAWGIPG